MDECEERWENGISGVDIENINSVVRIRPEHNCRLKYGSQYFLIKTESMRKEEFLEQIPLINERPREPGYYTWIVWSNGGSPQFTCCKTYSILEMGTIHIAIAFRMNAIRIHAAGEILVKEDGSLFFNFISGTFMLKEFAPGGKRRARCSGDDLENFLIEKMQEILGADATWSSREFIRFGENLEITERELELYKSFGAEVQLFPEDNQKGCYDARNIEGGKRKNKRKTNRKTKKRVNKKRRKTRS